MKVEFTVKNYRCFDDSLPLRFILEDGFTAFVGPNNSGKSSILKFFYEFRNLWNLISQPIGNVVNLARGFAEQISFSGVIDQNEIFNDSNPRKLTIEVSFVQPRQTHASQITKAIFYILKPGSEPGIASFACKADFHVNGKPVTTDRDRLTGFRDNIYLQLPDGSVADCAEFFETFGALSKSVYFPSFRNAINIGSGNYFDISIGTGFVSQWHDWNVGGNKFQNNSIQKITDDIRKIFRYDALQILASKELNTFQVYINGKSYKLQEIGSGIAQFILVFGNATVRQPSFIMIDEPELSLHPSLQIDFLTALTSYSQKGVLFATHSIGLARAVADNIYSVRADGKSSVVAKFEQTGNLSEFLGELSFSSFRELGFDKILLVEGVSEVKTIQQFLRLMGKDHEIMLLQLGGDAMINDTVEHELNELKRISEKIFVLIDSERTAKDASLPSNREGFRNICDKAGIDIHILERRAIENYFTENAIQTVKGSKYQALKPFEKLEECAMPWSKSENWRIAREMALNDIERTDLYDFLNKI